MVTLKSTNIARTVFFLVFLGMLTACAVKSATPSYYSLSPMSPMEINVHNMKRHDVTIGVGPVSVPDYLKRAQIVTRLKDNRYNFSEDNRWAGLIEENIVAVLGRNLGILLGTDKIASFPWLSHIKPDYRLVVEILRFDGSLDGDVVFSARWAVTDGSGEQSLASGLTDYKETLMNAKYEDLVAAESRLLAAFSKEIADRLKAMEKM